MIRLIAVAFALTVATSAQAISPAPLQQPDGMITQVREACGAGMHTGQWSVRAFFPPAGTPPGVRLGCVQWVAVALNEMGVAGVTETLHPIAG